MNKERQSQPNLLRRLGQVTALAVAGTLGAPAFASPARAESAPILVSCDKTKVTQVNLKQGNTYIVLASGAVLSADASVDKVKQFDNDADTASVFALKSSGNSDKLWNVSADYDGYMEVLKCGVGSNDTYLSLGRMMATVDHRNGINDPIKRVNFNVIVK